MGNVHLLSLLLVSNAWGDYVKISLFLLGKTHISMLDAMAVWLECVSKVAFSQYRFYFTPSR